MDDLTFFFIGTQNLKSNTSMKGLLAITLIMTILIVRLEISF